MNKNILNQFLGLVVFYQVLNFWSVTEKNKNKNGRCKRNPLKYFYSKDIQKDETIISNKSICCKFDNTCRKQNLNTGIY